MDEKGDETILPTEVQSGSTGHLLDGISPLGSFSKGFGLFLKVFEWASFHRHVGRGFLEDVMRPAQELTSLL